ncbi:hypothetical protein JRQ81_010738 [Phrynocephalus forsythii]|uniref:Uncharacterized protein n=1 Tax=Phrynocephalus forsythii TaxID=171643 RepID=A0A9Q1B5J4_9SAUR|nr:hypothetical protein JRQ81_010738 [Phrynocephalus forsythii]
MLPTSSFCLAPGPYKGLVELGGVPFSQRNRRAPLVFRFILGSEPGLITTRVLNTVASPSAPLKGGRSSLPTRDLAGSSRKSKGDDRKLLRL